MHQAIKSKFNRFSLLAMFIFFSLLNSGIAQMLGDGHQIFHFHGTTAESYIGENLKGLGDINGDGFDDIAFTSLIPYGIYFFLGGNPPDSNPDFFIDSVYQLGPYIDYDGDKKFDFIAANDSAIYLYHIINDSINPDPIDSLHAPIGYYQTALMDAQDINGDSIADLLLRVYDPYEGQMAALYYNPFADDTTLDWQLPIQNYSHIINSLGFIDFNGDSVSDIYVALQARLDTLGYVYIYFGPSFAESPDLIIGYPTEFDSLDHDLFASEAFNLGDIDGDNYEDLGILFNDPHEFVSLVYSGGPFGDTLYDYRLDGMCYKMAKAGDINKDGYNDCVIGGSDDSYGKIILYLGGPQFDTIRDDEIARSDLPPLFLERIGRRITSAGDFNGDGYDDILFKCGNFAFGYPGDVFIYSWGDDITSVDDDISNTQLPRDFILNQNYPNPFNPSTTIEFELPRKDVLTLDIYNILGQKVETLFSGRMFPAGTHTVYWDGTKQDGSPLPSGIYFYRISGNGLTESRKMVLLK